MTARRFARRRPGALKSADFWPGGRTKSRPDVQFRKANRFGEPGEVCQDVALLQSALSPRGRERGWAKASCPPPPSAPLRLAGGLEPTPKFPLCALGIPQYTLRDLYGSFDASSSWDELFEMGRAPYAPKYSAVWDALFESLAPLERALAPLYRHLLRARRDLLMGRGDPNRAEEVRAEARQKVTSVVELGVTPAEFGELLCAYSDAIPVSGIRVTGAREVLVGSEGGLQPLGVVAGMVFAMLTRASYSA